MGLKASAKNLAKALRLAQEMKQELYKKLPTLESDERESRDTPIHTLNAAMLDACYECIAACDFVDCTIMNCDQEEGECLWFEYKRSLRNVREVYHEQLRMIMKRADLFEI